MDNQNIAKLTIEEQILHELPTGVVIYDVTGTLVETPYMSNGFYQMLETTREERVKARGGNAMNTVHPNDALGLLAEAHTAIREKRMLDYRYRILNGKGEYISPTDMVAAALGSCMLTLMGIAARRLEIDLKGTRVEIQKVMAAEPRRIAEIRLDFYLPGDYSDKDKKILQGAAETCPVGKSLHPDIRQAVTWHYGSAK